MRMATTTRADSGSVGSLLRAWRERRGISQLELAGRADSSARHISFIETGRSRPSQEMVLRLADRLDVPVRERNELLRLAAEACAEKPVEPVSICTKTSPCLTRWPRSMAVDTTRPGTLAAISD